MVLCDKRQDAIERELSFLSPNFIFESVVIIRVYGYPRSVTFALIVRLFLVVES